MRYFFTILICITFSNVHAQTLGGNAAYNFLKLPYAPQLTAAGGVNISSNVNDVSFALQNPALLQPSLSKQLGISFTSFFAGIKSFDIASAYYHDKLQTTFGANLFYMDYGSFTQTDAAGNTSGTFHAADYVAQLSASKKYLEKWQYGASIKFIQSKYQQYNSMAVAADVGLHYFDSTHNFSMALLVKNMGAQIKNYVTEKEELPFDLQLGVTKKLAKAPFAFSITIDQLHRFNLQYRDTIYNNDNNFSNKGGFNKIANHFVFATQIFIAKQFDVTVGYNHLRRSELSIGSAGNGLTGFSTGFTARFEKLHISYARSTYQRGIAYNQLGINLMMDKLMGAGKL